jgi:hypothetical protein
MQPPILIASRDPGIAATKTHVNTASGGGITMALHFPPEWLDENLPEDFDPSDLSPYRALDRHADYVAEQLEKPPLIMIDLEGDSVEKIRQELQPHGEAQSGCSCGNKN